jgi:hypothetical protein
MDFQEKAKFRNPSEKANLLSRIFWTWIIPFFRKGYGKDLLMEDMYDVRSDDGSKYLGDRLEE